MKVKNVKINTLLIIYTISESVSMGDVDESR